MDSDWQRATLLAARAAMMAIVAVLAGCQPASPPARPMAAPPGSSSPAAAAPRPQPGPAPGSAAPQVKRVELGEAVAQDLASMSASGSGLDRMELHLTSKASEPLTVVVKPGTIFSAAAEGTQNMVARGAREVSLAKGQSTSIDVPVACINMHRDTPGGSDGFTVRPKAATGDLANLVESKAFHEADFRVQQFAIWTITDNPENADDYTAFGTDMSGSGPTADEMQAILALFKSVEIETNDYRALRHLGQ